MSEGLCTGSWVTPKQPWHQEVPAWITLPPTATGMEVPLQSPFHSLYTPAPETMWPHAMQAKLYTNVQEVQEGAAESQMRVQKLPTLF